MTSMNISTMPTFGNYNQIKKIGWKHKVICPKHVRLSLGAFPK